MTRINGRRHQEGFRQNQRYSKGALEKQLSRLSTSASETLWEKLRRGENARKAKEGKIEKEIQNERMTEREEKEGAVVTRVLLKKGKINGAKYQNVVHSKSLYVV